MLDNEQVESVDDNVEESEVSVEDENSISGEDESTVENDDANTDSDESVDGEEGKASSQDVDDDLVQVSIGEDSPPQDEFKKAPSWVKELRKNNRELKKQKRELQERLDAVSGADLKPVELGKKPSLDDPNIDYDNTKYEQELSSWYERKAEVEKEKAKIDAQKEQQQREWQNQLDLHEKAKSSLKVRDYDDAEETVQELLSDTQQGIIVQGSENSALVVYALGKNPKKLQELSQIKDPVKFAFTVSKLEAQLKVTKQSRPATKPERKIKSSSGDSRSANARLDRLRKDAEKSGDYSKVYEFKRKMRSK